MAENSWMHGFVGDGEHLLRAHQLAQTFEMLNHDLAYGQARENVHNYLVSFTQRWGEPSIDTLEAIAQRFTTRPHEEVALGNETLTEPQTLEEQDTLFALAALGVLRNSKTPMLLLPYLASPRTRERWLAALGLAGMHDERALPALEHMLKEFIGPNPHALGNPGVSVGSIFQNWRLWLLRLLPEWGDPRVVPPIRAGLIATVNGEEVEVPEPHGPKQEFVWNEHRYTGQEAWRYFYNEQLFWVDEEHEFVYALGRLGAFGALEGVPTRSGVYSWQDAGMDNGTGSYHLDRRVPDSHRDGYRANIWRVHMCFGALESRFRGQLGTINDFSDAPDLAEAVERLLAGKFGMDEPARRRAMDDYDQASWVYWTPIKYGWDTESNWEDSEDNEFAVDEKE